MIDGVYAASLTSVQVVARTMVGPPTLNRAVSLPVAAGCPATSAFGATGSLGVTSLPVRWSRALTNPPIQQRQEEVSQDASSPPLTVHLPARRPPNDLVITPPHPISRRSHPAPTTILRTCTQMEAAMHNQIL